MKVFFVCFSRFLSQKEKKRKEFDFLKVKNKIKYKIDKIKNVIS